MSDKNIIELLYCSRSSSNDDDKHIMQSPVLMSCGHGLCRNCIPLIVNGDESESVGGHICDICGKVNKHNLNESHEFPLFDVLLKSQLCELFKLLHGKYVQTFTDTQNTVHMSFDNRLSSQIEFAKEEIVIKIESLKNQLDYLGSQIIQELDDLNLNFNKMNLTNDIDIPKFDEQAYTKDLEELEKNIVNNENLSCEYLYECQERIKNLKILNDSLSIIYPKVYFEPSEIELNTNVLGRLVNGFDIKIENKISKGKIFPMCLLSDKDDVISLCNLQNNKILLASLNSGLLFTTDNLNGGELTCLPIKINVGSIDTNVSADAVYLTDNRNNCVYKLNMNLSVACSTDTNRRANQTVVGYAYFDYEYYAPPPAITQFNKPSGIKYFKSSVYVCDTENKRIVRLNENDLGYEQSFDIEFKPYKIKIVNNRALVNSNEFIGVCLFSCSNFEIICKYENHFGVITQLNNYFYLLDYRDNILYCYDYNGAICKKINASRICFNKSCNTTTTIYGDMILAGNKLILTQLSNCITIS